MDLEKSSEKRHKRSSHKKKKKHLRKRSRSSSSKTCSRKRRSSSISSTDGDRKSRRSIKKSKRLNKETKDDESSEDIIGPLPSAMSNDNMKPLTKEEWEKQQSVIRTVYDQETGRHRRVRGDGEILEEIVTFKRQKEINKAATLADGLDFKLKTGLHKLP